jgi:hypothetical protein
MPPGASIELKMQSHLLAGTVAQAPLGGRQGITAENIASCAAAIIVWNGGPGLRGGRSTSAGKKHLSPGLERGLQFLLRRRLRTLQQKTRDFETIRGAGKVKTLSHWTTDVT